jgi:hypothetical protein
MMIERYLDDLESRIDEDVEQQLLDAWLAFCHGEFDGDAFRPQRAAKAPPGVPWPEVSVNETLDDFEAMALQQFCKCSGFLEHGTGDLMDARSNYGTSIMPSMFGADLFVMEDELDTLPTSWPLSADRLEAVVAGGVPDIDAVEASDTLAGKTLRMAKYYIEIRSRWPKVGRYVQFYHPDLQGPMDVCEVLWGSGLFLDLLDKPERIHALLDILTETYERFMRRWTEILPFREDCNGHWHMLFPGKLMLRDDSAMNLSPAMFDEFIKPYDQRLLDAFGGGAIHFCGRGDHFIASMSRMNGLYAVQLSQPEYNDMEVIYRNTVDRGILLIGLPSDAVDAALAAGRDLHGKVHCK